MAEPPVNILLVDDHLVVRMGLAALLGTVPSFTVVGEAGTVAQAVEAARRCQPDVVIMDVRLPDGNGAEACRIIRSEFPQTHVIMLTSYTDEDAAIASVLAGASGYLLKEIDREQFLSAVRVVARGGSLLDPAVADTVLRWMRAAGSSSAAADDPFATLSAQERQILHLIADGKTNREIASALYLSEHSVKTYVSNILHKLHFSRRSEAAAFIARREHSGR